MSEKQEISLSGEMDTLKGNQMGIWELREQ